MTIARITAHQIYDSRGNPTVEAEVTLDDGSRGLGMVPSGASTGQYEALELRDKDKSRFRGKSVFNAIANIEQKIAPKLIGMAAEQAMVDEAMRMLDGTPTKSRLGANAILAVSMGLANAIAASKKLPLFASLGEGTLLPLPEIQIVGGGAHADWRTDIQDFLIIATGAKTFEDVMEITFNVYHATADYLRSKGKLKGLADEGGFWPDLDSNTEAFDVVLEGIRRAGYTPGKEASLSLDIAASDLYDADRQQYSFGSEKRHFTSDQFADLMADWCRQYPIVSIEDPMADTDLAGWRRFREAAPIDVQIIGDDLFTTNVERIQMGIDKRLANAVLIKLNQIGTVSETLAAIKLTQDAGWLPVVSARSGETEDAFISHLAVATDAGQLKVGSFARSERMSKWNEVLRIGRYLGPRAKFRGAEIFQELT
jgi:enolase